VIHQVQTTCLLDFFLYGELNLRCETKAETKFFCAASVGDESTIHSLCMSYMNDQRQALA
jgi:hypothetical protein